MAGQLGWHVAPWSATWRRREVARAEGLVPKAGAVAAAEAEPPTTEEPRADRSGRRARGGRVTQRLDSRRELDLSQPVRWAS